ncbi:MAG: hypothetical protein JXR71_09565 [Bacteroidales bacterium]|nr:hypothetical protein [Bacteroidales bacterium]
MKKLFLILIGVFMLGNTSFAQYNVNKTKYNASVYSYQAGDPYNPTLAAVESLFVPGLGQALAGETKRGLIIFGSYAGCWVVYGIGAGMVSRNLDNGGGWALVIAGSVGAGVIGVWNIFDAAKVAKINNLAYRANKKTSMRINLQPYVGQMINMPAQPSQIPVGMSLMVKF